MLKYLKNTASLIQLSNASYMPSLWQLYRATKGNAQIIHDTQQIIQTINYAEFQKIYENFKDYDPYPGASKYLDISTHIARAVKNSQFLGLHQSSPSKILDLGSGAGYFPYVCQYYGHQAEALDVDWTEMYNQIKRTLRLQQHIWQITAYQTLPADLGTFDYITAFQIMFDRIDGKLWTIDEWQFFLQNLRQHLNHRGQIFLGLNTLSTGEKTIFKENINFFRSQGAMIQGYNVLFNNQL